MKRASTVAGIAVLLLGLVASMGCGISATRLIETQEAVVRPTVSLEAAWTAEAYIETAVPATLTALVTPTVTPLPPVGVALKSHHGRYVTAMEGKDNWVLRQEPRLSPCGWFTLHHLDCGKVALETCNGRYVTSPKSGTERQDWLLRQESKLGQCGQFDLYELGNERVAFKTCAGKFFTAGDGNWPPPLQWSLVGETDILLDWEIFTVVQE